MQSRIKAVVLAAGKGTRLQSESCGLPKVMRMANGRPLLEYVLEAISFIDRGDTILVVGYRKEDVLSRFGGYPHAVQEEQLGTGHAVMSAHHLLEGYSGALLVCYGDMPLISRGTYKALIERHFAEQNDCTILSSVSDEDLPYGRIVRDAEGRFLKIVEDRDCSPEEKAIRELNTGLYVFESEWLFQALSRLKNDNAQGEYYLTDVPGMLLAEGARVDVCRLSIGSEILGVNTPEQLEHVEQILRSRGVS